MTFLCLFVNADDENYNYQLHVFADTSAQAITAIAYLRTRHRHIETVQVQLLCAKTKIVKPDVYTIPKLELMAVLLATKILKFVRSIICCDSDAYIWGDSKCALNWIKNTGKILPVFVANCVKQIRECPRIFFRYIASGDNPNDIPSRGAALSDLHANSLWWHSLHGSQRKRGWKITSILMPSTLMWTTKSTQFIHNVRYSPQEQTLHTIISRHLESIQNLQTTLCRFYGI